MVAAILSFYLDSNATLQFGWSTHRCIIEIHVFYKDSLYDCNFHIVLSGLFFGLCTPLKLLKYLQRWIILTGS
ncbi:hypothetical protein P8452_18163 [Trifolium repens]|nr:hypothetical protein P8452_18163 [Trifolium repens]